MTAQLATHSTRRGLVPSLQLANGSCTLVLSHSGDVMGGLWWSLETDAEWTFTMLVVITRMLSDTSVPQYHDDSNAHAD